MNKNTPVLTAIAGLVLCASVPVLAGELKAFPGVGRAMAEKAMFSQAKENQKALDAAQRLAVVDALKGALAELLGPGFLEPERMDPMVRDLADHGSAFIRDQIVKDSAMEGLSARTQILLKVDLAALRTYLKRQGVSLTQGLATGFKCFVLSYAVEGMDGQTRKPKVVEEAQDDERLDQPPSFYRVVEAPAGGKAMSGNSEARALLSGALQKAGLKVATIQSPLAGVEFKGEDEFINKVLQEVRRHPEVRDEDCVGIAINSLTPINARNHGHRVTSRVTVAFVRVGDGINLLPSTSIAKTSAVLPSDDEARTQALELCMATLKDGLPEEIRTLLQQLPAAEPQAAPAPGGFVIEVINIQDRAVLVKLKQWLKQQDFTFKSDMRAGGTVETLALALGERSPDDIKDILDGLPSGFELLSKTDKGAKVKVR